jgi:hypothetical protein
MYLYLYHGVIIFQMNGLKIGIIDVKMNIYIILIKTLLLISLKKMVMNVFIQALLKI